MSDREREATREVRRDRYADETPVLFRDDARKQEMFDEVYQGSIRYIKSLLFQVEINVKKEELEDSEEERNRKAHLKGLLRGRMGELVSNQISDFSQGVVIGQEKVKPEWKVSHLGSKSQLLGEVVKREADKRGEGEAATESDAHTKEMDDALGGGHFGSILNNLLEAPDAVGILGRSKVFPVEVKSYPPGEWRQYLERLKSEFPTDGSLRVRFVEDGNKMSLGWNPQGQQWFIDAIKGERLSDKKRRGELERITVLRVPLDAPEDVLQEINQLIQEKYIYGYGGVDLVVQKLPFTSAELDEMARVCLERRLALFAETTRRKEFDPEILVAAERIVGGKYIEGLGVMSNSQIEEIKNNLRGEGVRGEFRAALEKLDKGESLTSSDRIRLKEFRNFLRVRVQQIWKRAREGELDNQELEWLGETYRSFKERLVQEKKTQRKEESKMKEKGDESVVSEEKERSPEESAELMQRMFREMQEKQKANQETPKEEEVAESNDKRMTDAQIRESQDRLRKLMGK